MMHTPEMLPVSLRGIDLAVELRVTEAARSVTEGRLTDSRPVPTGSSSAACSRASSAWWSATA
ncbi:MAG: hypothetical protein U1F11_09345 [Steroidobacteraceae bacterium]